MRNLNKLREQLEQIIRETTRNNLSTTVGEILSFDNETMLAEIKIKSPDGAGMYKLKKVPMQLGSGGISQSGPYIGDKVVVNFKNGNINNPVVVSLLDTQHKTNFRNIREKHMRKGAMCPDNICIREDWEYTDPLYEEFIDTSIF